MKKEFILAYDRAALFSVLHNHKSLSAHQEDNHTLFTYVGEHKDNGFLALAEIFDGLSQHAKFSRRHELETNAFQIHPIPYIPFQREDGTIYTYQRGKGVGEERLAGDDSIAPGGHVELGDGCNSSPMVPYLLKFMMAISKWSEYGQDLQAMITATVREMHEEVQVKPLEVNSSFNLDELFKFELVGLLYDESNEVGKVHLGLIFRLRLPTNWTVTSREKQIEDRGFKLPEAILSDQNDGLVALESWSRILTEWFYYERALKANNA